MGPFSDWTKYGNSTCRKPFFGGMFYTKRLITVSSRNINSANKCKSLLHLNSLNVDLATQTRS